LSSTSALIWVGCLSKCVCVCVFVCALPISLSLCLSDVYVCVCVCACVPVCERRVYLLHLLLTFSTCPRSHPTCCRVNRGSCRQLRRSALSNHIQRHVAEGLRCPQLRLVGCVTGCLCDLVVLVVCCCADGAPIATTSNDMSLKVYDVLNFGWLAV
jgi:hypothetical protein